MRGTVFFAGVLLAALAAAPDTLAQGTVKIGVFDPQRVSEETEEGKRVQAELSALGDRKKAEIHAKEKELSDLQSQVTSQGLSLSEDRRHALEKDIQKKGLELQQAKETARNEMQFELGAAQSKFQDKLLVVVETFGRDEGFTLLLDRSMAAYAAAGIDVTTAIVDRFNSAVKPAQPARPAPPATPAPAPGPGR